MIRVEMRASVFFYLKEYFPEKNAWKPQRPWLTNMNYRVHGQTRKIIIDYNEKLEQIQRE